MAGILKIIEEYYLKNPDKLAVISNNEELTYKNLYFGSISFANYLNKLNIKEKSKIVIRANNDIDFWCVFFGSMLKRITLIIIDDSLPTSSLKDIYDSYDNISLIISNNIEDKNICNIISFSEIKKAVNEGYLDKYNSFFDIEDDDITNIIYTTGTTGKAKGVCWSYSYLWYSNFLPGCIPYFEDSIAVLIGKLNHTFGLGMGVSLLLRNSSFVHFNGLNDVDEFYNQINKYNVTSLVIPPSAMAYLSMVSYDKLSELSNKVRLIELAGEKLTKSTQNQIIKFFPNARAFVSYGSTEVGHIGSYEFSKYGVSDSRVMKLEEDPKIAFFDDDKNFIVPTKDNPSYIGIKMPFKIPGYYNDGDLNKVLLYKDYVITSDLGYLDDGFLCLSGRSGDIINSGGLKTNPLDVEAVAFETDMVKDCVCYGTSDEFFGKIVSLDIVIKDNFNKKEFLNIMKKNLVKNSVPKIINIVRNIKRLDNGLDKIDRKYYRNK